MTDIQQALEESDPLVGQTFEGRFQIISVLGQGGMGMVYKARHIHMDKLVAIKTLVPAAVSDDKSFLRFEQEARAASNLQHPNIVSIYDFGRSTDGTAYLVMEFLQGRSLEDDLVEQLELLSLLRFERIFTQICSAMQHAHKKGVIHRDLKPSNLMLLDTEEAKDVVKIVDFGLAKLNGNEQAQQHLTQTGMVMGSPPFMSPEQCRGDELDSRTDIYSLGCVMYAALTGQVPHMGNNSMATIYKHISDIPARISELIGARDVPPALEDLVMKTLAKRREDRPQTMEELGKAITDAIHNTSLPTASDRPKVIVGTDLAQAMPIKPKIETKTLESLPPSNDKTGAMRTRNGGTAGGGAAKAAASKKVNSLRATIYVSLAMCFLIVVLCFSILKQSIGKVSSKTAENSLAKPPESSPGAEAGSGEAAMPSRAASSQSAGTAGPAILADPASTSASSSKNPEPQKNAVAGENSAGGSTTSSAQVAVSRSKNSSSASVSKNTKKIAAVTVDPEQRNKHEALKNANYYREQGRLYCDQDDLKNARLSYERYLDDFRTAYGAEDPHLLHPISRILSCTKGKEDAASLANLDLALKIVGDERKQAFDTVKEMPYASATWRALAWACLSVARESNGASKRSYAQWSEYFYAYTVETWDAGKDEEYFKVLRGYGNAAFLCGDMDKVAELKKEFMASGQPFINLKPHQGPLTDEAGVFPRGGILPRKRRPFQNNW